jgi:hypothetical protein
VSRQSALVKKCYFVHQSPGPLSQTLLTTASATGRTTQAALGAISRDWNGTSRRAQEEVLLEFGRPLASFGKTRTSIFEVRAVPSSL